MKPVPRFLLEIYFRCLLSLRVFPRNRGLRGQFGEWFAFRMLKQKGYGILARNWRSSADRRMELDLVALDSNCLVFVEVRARAERSMITGWNSLNPKKKKNFRKAAMLYLSEAKHFQKTFRFDVVEIDLPENRESDLASFHHENIAIPSR